MISASLFAFLGRLNENRGRRTIAAEAADPEDAGNVGTGRVGIANNGFPVGAAGVAVVAALPKVKPANSLLAAGAGKASALAASALAAFHFLQRVPFYLVNNVSVAIAYTQTRSKRYERFLTWMF